MDKFREKALTQFCAGLHIVMDDLSLMDTALTHSSYAYEVTKGTRPEFNQRLEFLGDSVLSLVVSTYLYQHYPAMDEGQLSKFRAFLVCEETLAELAQEMHLGSLLLLGKGEHHLDGEKNPSILADVRAAGYVTAKPAARLMNLYTQAVAQGADAILNICSSVGEVADSFQPAARYLGIPVVRIDEEMCREAVRLGNRVGVLATLATTLEPTKNTIRRVAREMNRHVTLVDGLIDGAFGLDQEQFRALLIDAAMKIRDQVDVIVLAQGSMAYVEEDLTQATGKQTLSSPRFGAAALKRALEAKGLL